MIEKKVLVGDIEVNYKIWGNGKPMLILHGWGSSSKTWEALALLVSAHNFKLIIPDLPGFGLTSPPKTAWNLDAYVQWVLAFADALPELSQDFYLLGHSFGGAIASKFTIKYNQRVTKLFLISAACIRKNTTIKKIIYRLSKVVKLFSFLPYYATFRKGFYHYVLRKSDYSNVNGIIKETYLRVITEDLSYRLSFIKTPTIIIWGAIDDLTPLEQAKFIHSKISHSVLIVVPDQKHAMQIKAPELLAQKILEHV